MEDLELSRGASNLGIAKPKPAAKPVQPAKRKRKETEELPRRQSARLRKSVVDPNETPAQRKKRLVRCFTPRLENMLTDHRKRKRPFVLNKKKHGLKQRKKLVLPKGLVMKTWSFIN